jgi:hypothetical protein
VLYFTHPGLAKLNLVGRWAASGGKVGGGQRVVGR